jgi:citrate lyase subunit beta/citryl-CoA lyase
VVTPGAGAGGPRPLHCLLETAVGVEAAAEIARAPGVASIALGEADLSSDLGVSTDDALEWCRQRIVVAARAAGLPPPLMSVHTRLGDLDDLAESTQRARRRGFVGRSAIHPKQLPIIEAAFRPSDDEVKRAREVIASVENAQTLGDGTSVLADGTFLDVAMIEQARRVVELDERTANTGGGGAR